MTVEPRSSGPEARSSNWQPLYGAAIGIARQAEHVDFDETRRFLTALATGRFPDTAPTVPAERGG